MAKMEIFNVYYYVYWDCKCIKFVLIPVKFNHSFIEQTFIEDLLWTRNRDRCENKYQMVLPSETFSLEKT